MGNTGPGNQLHTGRKGASPGLTMDASLQSEITPGGAIALLKEGNIRFTAGKMAGRNYLEQVSKTGDAQYPFAAVVGCIDSRVPTELIFDLGIGDIFNVRIAGNIINNDILGSLEFAVKIAGAKAIVVLGHTGCGAIMGACDGVKMGNLTGTLQKLSPALDAVPGYPGDRHSGNTPFVHEVTRVNVKQSVQAVTRGSDLLSEMQAEGSLEVAGALYAVETGVVEWL